MKLNFTDMVRNAAQNASPEIKNQINTALDNPTNLYAKKMAQNLYNTGYQQPVQSTNYGTYVNTTTGEAAPGLPDVGKFLSDTGDGFLNGAKGFIDDLNDEMTVYGNMEGMPDPDGMLAMAGYSYNEDPKIREQKEQNRLEAQARMQARDDAARNAVKAYFDGNYERGADYGFEESLKQYQKAIDERPKGTGVIDFSNLPESKIDNTQKASEETEETKEATKATSDETPEEIVERFTGPHGFLDAVRANNNVSDQAIFDEWRSSGSWGDDLPTYDSLYDLMGSGSADATHSYMDYAYRNYGKYGDLAEYFDYDPEDEQSLNDALAAYEEWFNPWVASHSIDNIFNGAANGAEILGSHADDLAGFAQYLLDAGMDFTADNAQYQPVLDEYGNTIGVSGGPLLSQSEDATDILTDMLALYVMQNSIGDNATARFSDQDLDMLANRFDFYEDNPIDYGTLNRQIPMSDAVYQAYASELMNPESAALIGQFNPFDYGYYYNNENFAPMATQLLAEQMGYGSNVPTKQFNEAEWNNLFNPVTNFA